MRRALPLFLVASGCSLLFDPARVPVSGCPSSAERCAAPGNARAVCQETRCAFECVEGFRDADGVADNGCEASCAAPASPASLTATSVPGAGDSVDWTFPAVTDAASYRLCTGIAAGTPTCVSVPTSACTSGTCTSRTSGHPLKTQVSGQVQAVNACQTASPEAMAARASAFTIRATDVASWTSETSCMPMPSVAGDVLAVEQGGLCTGISVFGDEQWRSGTFDVELRPLGQLGTNVGGGLIFTSGSRRIGVLIGPATVSNGEGALAMRESLNNGAWKWLATSGAALVPDDWNRVRVVVSGPLWSVSLGKPNEPLREMVRYHDGASTGAAWRLGLHTVTPGAGQGRIEFRNLMLSTTATLPALGPASQTWTISPAGVQPPVRVVGAPQVRYETCPGFPAAAACTAATMCTPQGTTCARVVKAVFGGNSALTFDLPPGLDTRQPWNLRFRFAPAADGGFGGLGPTVAFSPHGALLEPENGFDGGVRGVAGRWGVPLVADTWNLVEYRFDPVAGSWSARLNGQPATPPAAMQRFPPNNWDKHVGAILFGSQGFNAVEVWLSDLSISP